MNYLEAGKSYEKKGPVCLVSEHRAGSTGPILEHSGHFPGEMVSMLRLEGWFGQGQGTETRDAALGVGITCAWAPKESEQALL